MGRGPSTFRKTDFVCAMKALRAAGLDIVRTELKPDGRIIIHHQAGDADLAPEDEYEAWKKATGFVV